MHKALRKSIKRALKRLPSVRDIESAAIAGKAKRHWYHRAKVDIEKAYGRDAILFAGILAATSPQQTVDLNLQMAKAIYAQWVLRGRPKDADTLADIARESNLHCRELNVIRAFKGKALHGLKVKAFYANLIGDYSVVTIDTWMITFAGLASERFIESKGGNIAYQHRVKRAAKRLGWRPAEIQAAVWSYCYARVNKIDVESVPEFDLEFDKVESIV